VLGKSSPGRAEAHWELAADEPQQRRAISQIVLAAWELEFRLFPAVEIGWLAVGVGVAR